MPPPASSSGWHRLGQPPPSALTASRLLLHWAAQIPAAIGYTLLDPEPNYGHLSLSWLPEAGVLASGIAPGSPPFRAALRLHDLTLLLLGPAENVRHRFALAGRTLDDGYAWLAEAVEAHTGTRHALQRPDHDLPEHPVGAGAAFTPAPDACAEWARWYANAHRTLRPLSQAAHASPVRCWPHHFDIATLMAYDPDKDPEEARSIGVGLSPGDGSYDQPYWYVLPWPPPAADALSPLGDAATWHTQGWTGAVLTGEALVAAGDAEAQALRVQTFIRAGIDGARRALRLR